MSYEQIGILPVIGVLCEDLQLGVRDVPVLVGSGLFENGHVLYVAANFVFPTPMLHLSPYKLPAALTRLLSMFIRMNLEFND
jgi:hypothetical protein